jgi:spermidine synthase
MDSVPAKRHTAKAAGVAAPNGLLLAAFIAAIFVSASLLFAVQPLFTKLVLPRFGGSPSVWSVAMVFFQAVLLAGYAYAHLLTRYLPLRYAIAVHLAVMLAAVAALPLSIAEGWGRPPAHGEAFYLIGLFSVSVGLPFFALAANSPLLQAWFARSHHPAASDPYFLYAASNVGSFLALLGYPLLAEPFTQLYEQRLYWSGGFYVLIGLIAICGALVWSNGQPQAAAGKQRDDSTPPTIRDALTWTALAAVPSAFLIAVTSHISTDVGSTPLLWVIPLALYLATYVIVFQRRPLIPHRLALAAQPVVIALLTGVYLKGQTDSIFTTIAINIAAFAITALVCHGELARRRPAARYLTAFYLWMSFGGMAGGIFAGLLAPYIFNWIAEYPLLIVAGLLCRPGLFDGDTARGRLIWFIAATLFAIAITSYLRSDNAPDSTALLAIFATIMLVAVILLRDPLKFAAVIGFALLCSVMMESGAGQTVRNFFGVHKIYQSASGYYRILLHGTTIHGAEAISETVQMPGARPVPLTYYHANSGMAKTIEAARQKKTGPLNMAVVGLGTGTLACYARPNDRLTFYEIDQSIIDVATNPKFFSFQPICAPQARIVLGDARLTIGDAPDGGYDIIIVDAFSSDAIPIHLLTQEAMAAYLAKLAPRGMIVLHISNRYLELASIVAGIADANGLRTRINSQLDEKEDNSRYLYTSTVTASARDEEDFGALQEPDSGWEPLEPDPDQRVWTDDYSNVVGAMIRHSRE